MSIEQAYQKIEAANIPSGVYQGYYWESSKTKPTLLDNQPITLSFDDHTLPFIIEGNFYNKKQNISIQVKNIDGKHHIAKIDLNNLPEEAIKKQSYLAHDIDAYKKFEVIEAWRLVAEPLMENMETFQPAWTAFIGFTNPK